MENWVLAFFDFTGAFESIGPGFGFSVKIDVRAESDYSNCNFE